MIMMILCLYIGYFLAQNNVEVGVTSILGEYGGYAYPHFFEWGYGTPTFYELLQLWDDLAITALPRFSS